MQFFLFVIQIGVLFFLSQILTKTLSRVFYGFFKSQSAVIHILSFLFLPGVVVHELSHLLTASILMVPTGEVEFFPEIHGNEVKMGSVAIAKTDPLRRFLIGVAPILMGLGLLFVVVWYIYPVRMFFSWQTFFLFYVIFEISNTMFSSKKDMEGAIGFLTALTLLCIILFFLGIKLPQIVFTFFYASSFLAVLPTMNMYLFVALFLDSLVIGLCMLFFLRKKY